MVFEIPIRYDTICYFSNRLPETASYNTSLIDHTTSGEQSEAKHVAITNGYPGEPNLQLWERYIHNTASFYCQTWQIVGDR